MKILVIHNDYQQAGGEKVAVNNLVNLLRERNHQVLHYTRDNWEISKYQFQEKVSFIPNTIYSQRTYQEVIDLVRENRPDIAHIHNVFPLISPSVYRALARLGIPIVQTIYNFRFLCPNGFFYINGKICERCKYGNTIHAIRFRCFKDSRLLSALYSLTIGLHRFFGTFDLIDRFISPAPFTGKKLIESGLVPADKMSTISFFTPDPLPKPGSFQARQPYMVFLGRLSPEKGIQALIEAVNDLPDIQLKVIGGGPKYDQIKSSLADRDLKNIEMLGYIFGEPMHQILREATASIVPSVWYENSPYSVIDSLLVGTPVIASNLGSLADIVVNGVNGLLFEPGNIDDLKAKILRMHSDPDRALGLGRNGYQRAIIQFSGETHYRNLLSIYSELSEKSL